MSEDAPAYGERLDVPGLPHFINGFWASAFLDVLRCATHEIGSLDVPVSRKITERVHGLFIDRFDLEQNYWVMPPRKAAHE